MKIKKFNDKKQEKIKNAKETLKVIDQIASSGMLPPSIEEKSKKMEKVLEDPYTSTKKDVDNLVTTIAQIKETGLSPQDPTVENWTKKELGINGEDLNTIFENNDTPEEVKKEILEKMEAPEELVNKVEEEINVKKEK